MFANLIVNFQLKRDPERGEGLEQVIAGFGVVVEFVVAEGHEKMEPEVEVHGVEIFFVMGQAQAGGRIQSVLDTVQDAGRFDFLFVLAAYMGVVVAQKDMEVRPGRKIQAEFQADLGQADRDGQHLAEPHAQSVLFRLPYAVFD